MTATFPNLQTAPRDSRVGEVGSRRMLAASGEHLEHAAQALSAVDPDYRTGLHHSIEAIRKAYMALLDWHTVPVDPNATLTELEIPAESLAHALRTCFNRALPLEKIAASLRETSDSQSADRLELQKREEIEMGYYTARNALSVVLGSLPERISTDAIRSLNRAHAVRIGRHLAPEHVKST